MGTSRIQEGEFGEYLTRNKNITADLFRKSSEQKVGFIKTLAEFSSVECKTILKRIEQKHVSMANTLFLEIEDMTHDLNQMEKETLLNPPSITRDLFHKHFSSQVFPVPEPEKVQYIIENVSSEEIDQVLYNHAYCLGLTDIGNGYPRTVPVLKYHAQSKFLDDTSEKIVTKAIKKKTKKLTNLLKSNELIPHTGYKFPFAELLKACGVSPGLVDTVCYTERFTTFEKLSDALATGGLNGIQGVGFDKIRIIANFLAKYERAVKQNPTITAGAINSEMVNDVNIPSETVIDLNSESEIPNTVTLPHKSSIRSITTPVSSKPDFKIKNHKNSK